MILTLLLLLTGRDVHLFVDEFVVNDSEDLKTLDAISEKIDLKNHVWITVAKASETHRYDFEDWLEKKIKEGYREPSLKYPLRNTKEIIKFEKSLLNPLPLEQNNEEAIKLVESENSVASIIDMKIKENLESKNPVEPSIKDIEKIVETTNHTLIPYGLPRPLTELEIPANLISGDKVCIKIHDGTNEVLVDALKRCFKILPAHRVLIIVLAEEISWELISAVEEARGQRRPLVIDRQSQADSSSSRKITQVREYELLVRKWLIDLAMTQDLIASSCVIAGFEWSSVLIITNDNHKSKFYTRNMVMRAMSRLVWLKTNSLDEVNEQKQKKPEDLDSMPDNMFGRYVSQERGLQRTQLKILLT